MEEGQPLRAPAGLGRGRGAGVDEWDGEFVVERDLAVAVAVGEVGLVLAGSGAVLLAARSVVEAWEVKLWTSQDRKETRF